MQPEMNTLLTMNTTRDPKQNQTKQNQTMQTHVPAGGSLFSQQLLLLLLLPSFGYR